MSSKADPLFPKTIVMLSASALLVFAQPLTAQDGASVTQGSDTAEEAGNAPPARRQFNGINLSVTVPKNESDQLLEEDCEEEADAAKITNEIVVCRQLGEATDGIWNREDFERRYAQRTQGRQPVNTFGIADHGNGISVGSVPPPALLIDVEALPQAPEGSDADRIARGLPPLGQTPDLTPEQIAERRRALGLDTPPIPEE